MRRKPTTNLVTLAVLAGLALPAIARAADSCPAPCLKPPANSRYVSTPGLVPLPPGLAPLLVATPALKLGKPKRVLVVEAMVATPVGPPYPAVIAMWVDVNGLVLEPAAPLPPLGAGTDCASAPHGACMTTGTFWIDLDQNPALQKVPLNVTLVAVEFTGSAPLVVASMAIRLEKK